MQNKFLRRGCLLIGLFTMILLVIGGGWWFLRSQLGTVEGPAPSPVQAFLLSPASGDEFSSGDYLPVTLQAFSPKAIVSAELFVDGKSLGVVSESPESARWSWQAWPPGIHTLSAQAADANGQIGQSQTVIVTVLQGDGVMQVSAAAGQTIEQIGAGFGVPPDQMASANPNVNPAQPLADGQPVQVPTGGGTSSDGSGAGDVPGDLPIPDLITWQFQPTEQVNKSYCYTSFGNGVWHKMPKQPFEFFSGGGVKYSQYGFDLKGNETLIKAQCWGWQGGALKYLGEGETQFDLQKMPEEVVLVASGFQLTGIPEMKPMGGGGFSSFPPPYALREPSSKEECHQNHGLGALFICELLEVQPGKAKDKYILVWEWQPPSCWPGQSCITKIDGYRLYEIDSAKSVKLLKELDHQGQKAAVVPMGWASCYGVRAYIEDPATESAMVTWCPGQQPAPQVKTLNPTDWLTTGGMWIQDGDCDTYGGANYYLSYNGGGFGDQPGEVLVGGYIVDDDDEDCFRQGDYSGGVKFTLPALPPGTFIQKIVLKFSEVFTDYKVAGVATNYKLFCVGGIGTAEQDWTGLGGEKHFVGDNLLIGHTYGSKFASLSAWNNSPEIDVTAIVNDWIEHPSENHGFILYPASVEGPLVDGTSTCHTGVGNVQLEIHYFAP